MACSLKVCTNFNNNYCVTCQHQFHAPDCNTLLLGLYKILSSAAKAGYTNWNPSHIRAAAVTFLHTPCLLWPGNKQGYHTPGKQFNKLSWQAHKSTNNMGDRGGNNFLQGGNNNDNYLSYGCMAVKKSFFAFLYAYQLNAE